MKTAIPEKKVYNSSGGTGVVVPPALKLPPSDSVYKNLNNCWTNDAPMSRANISKIRSKRTNGPSSEFFMRGCYNRGSRMSCAIKR